MRLVLTLILALLLSSCDVHFLTEFEGRYDEHTFEKQPIPTPEDVKLDILVFSDAHIGREVNDSGVTEYNDELVAELEEGYDLVLSVGDLSDEGDITCLASSMRLQKRLHSSESLETMSSTQARTRPIGQSSMRSIMCVALSEPMA